MNWKRYSLFGLLVVPVLFIIVATLHKEARGPNWLGSNYDPEYAYLITSLSLSHGGPVNYLDHPGITIRYLGAPIIRLLNPFKPTDESFIINELHFSNYVAEVLRYPEFYLDAIILFFLGLNTILLVVVGISAYRWTQNIWLAALLQTSPFIASSTIISYTTAKVSPESILLFTMLVFILLLIIMLQDKDAKKHFWFALGFAAIIAFGMATKFTFLPIAIVPLFIIGKYRYKLLYILSIPLFFYIFTEHIIGDYKAFFEMIINGIYLPSGGGNGLFDWRYLLDFTKMVVLDFRYQLIIVAIIVLSYLVVFISRSKEQKKLLWRSIEFRYAIGVVLAFIITVVLVSKRPNYSYFIPTLLLMVPLLVIYLHYVNQQIGHLRKVYKFFYPSCLLLVVILFNQNLHEIKKFLQAIDLDKKEQLALYNTVETQYRKYKPVFFFRSSHPLAALSFGYGFSRQNYDAILRTIYIGEFNFDPAIGFHHWRDPVDLNGIYDFHNGRVIFFSTPFSEEFIQQIAEQYQLQLIDVYNGQGQTIYQLERMINDNNDPNGPKT